MNEIWFLQSLLLYPYFMVINYFSWLLQRCNSFLLSLQVTRVLPYPPLHPKQTTFYGSDKSFFLHLPLPRNAGLFFFILGILNRQFVHNARFLQLIKKRKEKGWAVQKPTKHSISGSCIVWCLCLTVLWFERAEIWKSMVIMQMEWMNHWNTCSWKQQMFLSVSFPSPPHKYLGAFRDMFLSNSCIF